MPQNLTDPDAWVAQKQGTQQPAQQQLTDPDQWVAKHPINPITGTTDSPSVGGFLYNAGTSGLNFIGDTGKGLGNLALGAGKLGWNLVTDLPGTLSQAPKYAAMIPDVAKGIGAQYKEKYGGLTNIAHTAYTDPFGMAGDVAAVASLGETAVGSVASKIPALEGVARGLGTVAKYTDPISATTRGIASKIKSPERAEKMMTTALNPTEKVMKKDPNLVKKALQMDVSVSPRGARENQSVISALMDDMTSRTTELTDQGVTTSGRDITTHPNVLEAGQEARMQMAPSEHISAHNSAVNDFWTTHGSTEVPGDKKDFMSIYSGGKKSATTRVPNDLTPTTMRDLASGTYSHIENAYAAPRGATSGQAAEMALASAAVDEIIKSEERLFQAGVLPDQKLRAVGMSLKDRISLQQVIHKALHDEAGNNSFLRNLSGGAGTAAVAGSLGHPKVAGAAAGVAAARYALARKDVQSAIAQWLNKPAKGLSTKINTTARVGNALPSSIEEPPR